MLRQDATARGFAWLSLGLGASALLMPRNIARLMGVSPSASNLIRLVGVRKLATGVALLAQKKPDLLWARLLGNLLDLALLGSEWNRQHRRPRLAAALLTIGGVTALDVAATKLSAIPAFDQRLRRSITIRRSPDEVYSFWRDLQNLPRFMAHLLSVDVLDSRRSRWRARAPLGEVGWEAEIVDDEPGRLLSWRTVGDGDIDHRGLVTFVPAPGDRGTEIHVELIYKAPAGELGKLLAKLFGAEPGQTIASDLRRLKQILELGEVVHSDASIHRGMHPAQPSEEETPPIQPTLAAEVQS